MLLAVLVTFLTSDFFVSCRTLTPTSGVGFLFFLVFSLEKLDTK